jgi:branched-subunit amino acid ABC-type transport system permease component
MTGEIALILSIDGLATGTIYVLVGLGLVLVFSVTRVVFVPFGDVVAFSALTLAALQLGRLPGTVLLIPALAAIATTMEAVDLLRRGERARLPHALALYGLLPLLPAAAAWLAAGRDLPDAVQIAIAIALTAPLAPLLDRIAFRPLADASALLLLIVAVALHFALSGIGLLIFGAEGFRTRPLADQVLNLGGVIISAQVILMVVAALLFSLLLFLFFDHTLTGKALRATAVNRLGARLVGVRPGRTGALAFLLASLIGAISGILIGPVTTLYYDSGFLIGLKAFVGAIVGGLTSYPLTALGALFVGLLESFASFFTSTLKEVVVFGSLIPILLWRSLATGGPGVEEEEDEEA